MNIKTFIAFAVAVAIPLISLIFISGCESADDYKIDVTPPYTDVHTLNQSVTLYATGWSDYLWELSNKRIGYLSATHGESVTYVVKELPAGTAGTNFYQTITVSARNAVVSSVTSTSTVSSAYSAKSIVRHMPAE